MSTSPYQVDRAPDEDDRAPDQADRAPDQADRAPDQADRAPDQADQAPECADHADHIDQVDETDQAPAARALGRPRSAEAERAILGATVELFTVRGLAGLSVEAVAARAGVGKTTIYRRWPSKEELVLAAVTALKGAPPEPPGVSVRDDLLHLALRIGRRNAGGPWPALMSRLMSEAEEHPELAAEAWRRTIGPRRAILDGVLRRGVAEGLIRPDADLALAADMLVAPVLGRVRPGRPPLTEAQIGAVVDTVLRGLAP